MKKLKDTTNGLPPEAPRECPNCHTPVRAGSKFCYNCRQRLDDETTIRETPGADAKGKITNPLSALPDDVPTDPPSIAQGAALLPPGPVAALLARPQSTRSLVALCLDLGMALLQRQEYVKAAAVLQATIDVPEQPSEIGDILFSLAYSYERGGNAEKAFRSYLEALLHASDQVETIIPHLHELLSPEIALFQGKWIINEWQPRIKTSTTIPVALVHIVLFIGRIHLFTVHYGKALQCFEEAKQIDANVARSIANELLQPDKLPPALADNEHDGNIPYQLARFYYTLGNGELASQHLHLALKRGLTETRESASVLKEAYQLKVTLLEQEASRKHDGDQGQMVSDLYEAAEEAGGQNELEVAIPLLERAIALNPQFVQAHWALAEYLRQYSAGDMASAKVLIEKSLSAWERAYELQPVDASTSWVYMTRAFMNEQFALFAKEQVQMLRWEALAYMERCMLYPADALAYAYLGRYYFNVGLSANALQATERAVILDPEGQTALDERRLALESVGNYADAETIIDKLLAIVPADANKDIRAVKADMAFKRGRYQEGAELFSPLIERFPNEVWYRSRRARCYLWQGKPDLAMQDFRWIWEHNNPSNSLNQVYYGWAAYRLGEVDAALAIFQKMALPLGMGPGEQMNCIGQCYLSQQKFELAKDMLSSSVGATTNCLDLDYMLVDLDELLQFFPSQVADERAHEVIAHIKEKIEGRKAELEQLPTAEEELRKVLAQSELTEQTNGWSWIAAQAGLAQLLEEKDEWIEVAKIYLQLREKEGERFPDLRSIQNVIEPLQNGIDYYMRTETSDELFEDIVELMGPLLDLLTTDLPTQARANSQLGYIHFMTDELEAMNTFIAAIQAYRDCGYPNPGSALGADCLPMLYNATRYWALSDAWKALTEKPEVNEPLRSDLEDARAALASYLDTQFQFAEPEPEDTPALHIDLSITNRLLPEDGKLDWEPILTYLDQLRLRYQKEMGIYLPDIVVQYKDLGEDDKKIDYAIALNDKELFAESIPLGMRYSPISPADLQVAGVSPDALVAMLHPLTGAPGCWVASTAWEQMSELNLEIWPDEILFMVYRLDAVMRTRLADIMGVDEADRLVSEWKQNELLAPLIASALPDEHTQFRFARVLRALVQEQVPLTDVTSILTAIQGPGLRNDDLNSVVRQVQLALKKHLPGDTPPETKESDVHA